MHCKYDTAHEHDVVYEICLVGNQHIIEENLRVLEVTIRQHSGIRTLKVRSVHSVNSVDDAVKCCPKVTNVPHPAQHRSDVDVSRTEAKYREHHRQDRPNKHGQLKEQYTQLNLIQIQNKYWVLVDCAPSAVTSIMSGLSH